MRAPIYHYHHLYLDGDADWKGIAEEYAAVLKEAKFPEMPRIGLVGRHREPAKRWLDSHMPGWILATESDSGFEQITLQALQKDLSDIMPGTVILYTHNKGAWRNMFLEDQWRRSMLWHLVFGWQNCINLLEAHQVAGCHWMGNHFAGNFWWARSSYLTTLPPIHGTSEKDRGLAELWIGEGQPSNVANLVEGFASPDLTESGALATSQRLPMRLITYRHTSTWPK